MFLINQLERCVAEKEQPNGPLNESEAVINSDKRMKRFFDSFVLVSIFLVKRARKPAFEKLNALYQYKTCELTVVEPDS